MTTFCIECGEETAHPEGWTLNGNSVICPSCWVELHECDQTNEEIVEEFLKGADVPAMRRDLESVANLHWLGRNIKVRNKVPERVMAALSELQKAKMVRR